MLKFKTPAQSEVIAHITKRSKELRRDGLFGEKKVQRLEEEIERLRKDRADLARECLNYMAAHWERRERPVLLEQLRAWAKEE